MLKQAEVDVPVVELIRKVGISEQTFYRWKAKYVSKSFVEPTISVMNGTKGKRLVIERWSGVWGVSG